jgi:hypothetical protein
MTQHVYPVQEDKTPRAAFVALFAISLVAMFAIPLIPAAAQQGAHISAVDPGTGKVNDPVTATGSLLAKTNVVGIFLSDDKNDYKATIVSQDAEKIVFKVPEVKAGDYNVSIQVGGNLLIQPVKFIVQ